MKYIQLTPKTIILINIAVNGRPKSLLVHRKGSTRAFPPHHPLIPVDYQMTGQPVLIGGTMGSCSYVLTGTDKVMNVNIYLCIILKMLKLSTLLLDILIVPSSFIGNV